MVGEHRILSAWRRKPWSLLVQLQDSRFRSGVEARRLENHLGDSNEEASVSVRTGHRRSHDLLGRRCSAAVQLITMSATGRRADARRPVRYRVMAAGGWVVALVVVDLVTKWFAVQVAGDGDRGLITPRLNEELALGVTSGGTNPLVLVGMASVAVAVFVHAARLWRRGSLATIGLASLVAGAVANAVDRAVSGGVHDWFRTGPIVINVADVLIVVGLIWYVVASSREHPPKSRT